MGAWGVETFENDTALDWIAELEGTTDMSVCEASFAEVLENADEYLDADLACRALAACEVVARLQGNAGTHLVADVDTWVEANPQVPEEHLITNAIAVIDRVLAPQSELRELWEEGEASEWLESVEDLRDRIQS